MIGRFTKIILTGIKIWVSNQIDELKTQMGNASQLTAPNDKEVAVNVQDGKGKTSDDSKVRIKASGVTVEIAAPREKTVLDGFEEDGETPIVHQTFEKIKRTYNLAEEFDKVRKLREEKYNSEMPDYAFWQKGCAKMGAKVLFCKRDMIGWGMGRQTKRRVENLDKWVLELYHSSNGRLVSHDQVLDSSADTFLFCARSQTQSIDYYYGDGWYYDESSYRLSGLDADTYSEVLRDADMGDIFVPITDLFDFEDVDAPNYFWLCEDGAEHGVVLLYFNLRTRRWERRGLEDREIHVKYHKLTVIRDGERVTRGTWRTYTHMPADAASDWIINHATHAWMRIKSRHDGTNVSCTKWKRLPYTSTYDPVDGNLYQSIEVSDIISNRINGNNRDFRRKYVPFKRLNGAKVPGKRYAKRWVLKLYCCQAKRFERCVHGANDDYYRYKYMQTGYGMIVHVIFRLDRQNQQKIFFKPVGQETIMKIAF